jgi:DNA polymerase/3'-5' exonuclease PolX
MPRAAQKADPFRIAAYRRAAESIRVLNDDLGASAEKGGRDALEAVPFIGTSIASAIAEMVTTGRWRFLEHLKGSASPETLFQSVPGTGRVLAHRVCETLKLDTIEALEAAAHDGRLEQVHGPCSTPCVEHGILLRFIRILHRPISSGG